MSRFRKILLAFLCFCLVAGTTGTVVALQSLPPECAAERKYVHVSIDDCWQALARLSAPETKSVFDDPFFARLKAWHEAYGAKFTCYVFGETENFSLSDVPEKFKDEFAAASSWLKFGFHASFSGIEKTRAQSAEEFAENFAKTNAAIDAFAGTDARTTALRLDYFFAKDEWMPAIFAAGTRRLFGPDTPGRKAYALDAAASAELWARGELAFPYDQMGGGVYAHRRPLRKNLSAVVDDGETPRPGTHRRPHARMGDGTPSPFRDGRELSMASGARLRIHFF